MKINELITLLKDLPNDLEIKFSYSLGDLWETVGTRSIDSVKLCKIGYSKYHKVDVLIEPDDFGIYEDVKQVAVISNKRSNTNEVVASD